MIDILIPSLGKRDLTKVINNIHESTDNEHTVTVIFEPDTALEELPDANIVLKECGSAAKAVNYGFKLTKEPYFIFWNDDFNAQPHWDTEALKKMSDTVSVVAINDGNPNEVQWGTICLVKRDYINDHGGTENKGEVFHEGYGHWYVDSEFWERAMTRKMADTAPESVIIHEHPVFDQSINSSTYQRPGKSIERDSQLYVERRREYT